MRPFLDQFRPKALAVVACYLAILFASFWLAYELRFDFQVDPVMRAERLQLIGVAVGIKFLGLVLLRQTGSMLRYFSIPDLLRVGTAMFVSALLMILPRFLGQVNYIFPRGVLVIDLLLSVTALTLFRLFLRLCQERMWVGKGVSAKKLEPILIVGAGDTGASLAKELLAKPGRGFKPIAFLDDDTSKRSRRIHGIEVLGCPEEVPENRFKGVRHVVLAIPSAPQKRIRELSLFFVQKGFKVETVPAIEDLASGRVRVSQIRPVDVEDLLGRECIAQDTAAVRGFVEGKVVLVTGAGGSIGSELCRQIGALNPQRLFMMDQSEPSLFLIEQEMNERGVGAIATPLVADVLDVPRMEDVFRRLRPQVIFHAAAHKHVYLMERQPGEAIRNNSVGTRQLAQIAVEHGAEAFVLISTDKAINPTNVMGASKRLAEIHLQALHSRIQGVDATADGDQHLPAQLQPEPLVVALREGAEPESPKEHSHPAPQASRLAPPAPRPAPLAPTKLMAVRFGNVLGSSGSVVPIFRKQIAAGGPVTVTHPDVVRYFMTIPEAVGLVMQAAVLGKGGDIFVLDMGKPVKIVDLARQMIELSGFTVGEDIEIQFSGLKPGEKLFEELQHKDEQHLPTAHPRVMRFVAKGDPTAESSRAVDQLEPLLYSASPNRIKEQIKSIIPEYTPHLE